MKIFVIHYKKLIDRKINILEQFKKYNITDYEFIEIDRDELNEHNISMFENNYHNYQIAISLSHFYAYKEINDKYDNALILEDDAILSDDFINKLNKYVTQIPYNYDMVFIGDGCQFHIEKEKLIHDKYIYEKSDRCGRCSDSYLVSKKCAKKLCDYIDNLSYKINLPIDFWLNIAANDNILNVYWAEPTIVTQGSQNGLFQSCY